MILLTGASGMIGRNLVELLPPMLAPTHKELDLTDAKQVKDYLQAVKPELIIHAASNDDDICLYDNLRMFMNLAESNIKMITFCTGRETEDRERKNGEYVLSKHIIKTLAYDNSSITMVKIWGCFGKYEKESRFLMNNMLRVKEGLPIKVVEDKLFSYVYVKDLADIIGKIIKNGSYNLLEIVGYTRLLSEYAAILKKVTKSPDPIVVEKKNIFRSYVGVNTWEGKFTPLKQAISEMWEAVK